MTKKTWIIFVAVCVVLLGGLVVMSNKEKVNVSSVDANKIQSADDQSGGIAEHVFGNKDSKVMLVEYGDYQCPGCGSAYPVMKTLSEKYQGQIGFVFRNFPLTQLHPNARAAAAAAEAAGLQNKYWEMHNKLYESQSAWESLSADTRTNTFVTYAKDLGLDTGKFTTDLSSDNVNKKISFDQAVGTKVKVSGTPTFYLNGKAADQYVKDGKIVPATTAGANPIWSDADSFEKLLLIPALKEAGIAVPAAS